MNTHKQYIFLLVFCSLIGQIKASSIKASTFGWNNLNATQAFTSAINSPNDTIIIDLQVSDWMINSTNFTSLTNKTIIFESGVNLVARKGAFSNIYASLMTFYEAKNVKILGYGATFKMQKAEYLALKNSEHRHCIQLISCSNIQVYGLKLMDSGGDGIIIASYTGIAEQRYSENIFLKDLWCDNNYRQGISIISVQHLRVENCWFTNTTGTAPQAGLDIEPNKPFERLIDIVFEKCRFVGNAGSGILIAPISIDSTTQPMDITFNNCYVANNGINKYQIATYSYANGAKGNVNFNHCMAEGGTHSVGGTKLASGYKANFKNCVFKDPTNVVINFDDHTTSSSKIRNGGVSFSDCLAIYNTTYRYFNIWHANTTWAGLEDVQFNNFTTINSQNVNYNNGSGNIAPNCVFNFKKYSTAFPSEVILDIENKLMVECNNTNSILHFKRDSFSNINYPIAVQYTLKGDGVQGQDFSRLPLYKIIPKDSFAISDTIFVLKNNIEENIKRDSILLDSSVTFTTHTSERFYTIVDTKIPQISIKTDTICNGQTASLIASGADNYIWSNNEISDSISVSPEETTNYSLTANYHGCPTTKVDIEVVVKSIPNVIVQNDTICLGQLATLHASGASEYLWSTNETGNSIDISPVETTNYTVIGSTNGCSKSIVGKVEVHVLPVLNLGRDTTILNGHHIVLNATNINATYLWSNGETTDTIIVESQGSYSVTVTNEYNCIAVDTISIILISKTDEIAQNIISVFPNPAFDFISVQSVTQIQEIQISNLIGQEVLKYIPHVSSNELLIDILPIQSGTFVIKIIGENDTKTTQLVKL